MESNHAGGQHSGGPKGTFEAIRRATSDSQTYQDQERIELGRQRLRELETDRKGRESYYELRSRWSSFLRWLLAFMVTFQFLVAAGIGFQVLDFMEYKTFLYALLIENFLQIVGMAIVVVAFLFPNNNKKEPQKTESRPVKENPLP